MLLLRKGELDMKVKKTLTPPGHLVSPLVCRGPWMSTVVLYCWCHSDSASVLLYFTLKKSYLSYIQVFQRPCRQKGVSPNKRHICRSQLSPWYSHIKLMRIKFQGGGHWIMHMCRLRCSVIFLRWFNMKMNVIWRCIPVTIAVQIEKGMSKFLRVFFPVKKSGSWWNLNPLHN